jgi:beta-phosphoglucomutase-like phosphatase (HAD superfamily)
MPRDTGLDTLLDLDGTIIDQGSGYWVKIEVRLLAQPTTERPHGIAYSLTLHNPSGQRILGFDNAHAVKRARRQRYSGRCVEYDHEHRFVSDPGKPYTFVDAYQLLRDFFKAVDRVLKEHRGNE